MISGAGLNAQGCVYVWLIVLEDFFKKKKSTQTFIDNSAHLFGTVEVQVHKVERLLKIMS